MEIELKAESFEQGMELLQVSQAVMQRITEPDFLQQIAESEENTDDAPIGLNVLSKEIYQNAVDKGFWDEGQEGKDFGSIIALIHSELSEALEEYRNHKPEFYFNIKGNVPLMKISFGDNETKTIYGGKGGECTDIELWNGEKPEGIATELADAIIRILDYCGRNEIDIDRIVRTKMAYNKTRPHMHGGKKI